MKILIIGKNGQVGASLIALAKTACINYMATDRETLDITNQHVVNDFFNHAHAFDFVINAAAYTHVDNAEKEMDAARAANYHAVQYLAHACKKYDIPFIHMSTDYVFDGNKPTHYNEEDAPNPSNVYGQSKLDGENCLKETWHKHIILRVSWVFSEYGKNFVKTIANLCDRKEIFSIVGDQTGSPTCANSIASVILDMCQFLKTRKDNNMVWGIYHYSDFPATNWHQLATHVARHKPNKITQEIIAIESKDYPVIAQRPKNSILNTQKIKNIFGIDQKLWTTEVERIVKQL